MRKMKLKEWLKSNELLVYRTVLTLLLLAFSSFLFYEQCTPLYPIVERVWVFVGRVSAALWGELEWPHAALIIFVLLVFNYKKEIGSFIQRVDEVGVGGLKAHRPEPPVTAAEAGAVTTSNAAESTPACSVALAPDADTAEAGPVGQGIPLPPVYFPGQMRQVREWLTHEIELIPDDDKVRYLLDHLSYCRVWGDFESTYSIALGGQLNLLNEISLNYANGMPMAVVERLWHDHQEKLKPIFDQWTIDQYTWLLKSRYLLLENNGLLAISTKGREFLAYLSAVGKSLDKPW